jgi:hypothetical protein
MGVSEEALGAWYDNAGNGRWGAPPTYSGTAILSMASRSAVYRLALRATPGLRGRGHAMAQGCAGGATLNGLVPAAPDAWQ